MLALYDIVYVLALLASLLSLEIFSEESFNIVICASQDLFKYSFIQQLMCLLNILLQDQEMYNECAVIEDRYACKRCNLRNCADEVKDDISNVDIRCLFDDKL